jgi:hypothetical protein
MILFYSDTCQHCAILLDTIKRHDTNKTIKLVVIDAIVNKISHKITAVPALMFIPSKEIIYGKAVFDYLLLPNRGYLFTNSNTRNKQETISSISSPIPLNRPAKSDEPISFSLGAITADNFSDITDDNINSMNINDDKLYKWGLVDETLDNINNNNINNNTNNTNNNTTKTFDSEKSNKKLPSIDELQKQRENIFKDI